MKRFAAVALALVLAVVVGDLRPSRADASLATFWGFCPEMNFTLDQTTFNPVEVLQPHTFQLRGSASGCTINLQGNHTATLAPVTMTDSIGIGGPLGFGCYDGVAAGTSMLTTDSSMPAPLVTVRLVNHAGLMTLTLVSGDGGLIAVAEMLIVPPLCLPGSPRTSITISGPIIFEDPSFTSSLL